MLIFVDQIKSNRFSLKNLHVDGHFMEDLTVSDKTLFLNEALSLFRHQAKENLLYAAYLKNLSIDVEKVQTLDKIPFLPIGFFKTHQIKTHDFEEECIFESSGTTSSINSKHCVKNISAYLNNAERNFNEFYGELKNYCILALLPSYLERTNSSLVCMAADFIKKSGHPKSGFFLHDQHTLHETLLELERVEQPTILIGVTFALIDFAEKYQMKLNHTLLLETGGMKGRRKEMTRFELHQILTENLGLQKIHAEYGMTELLSQAYSLGSGVFKTPKTMKVFLRALDDPFDIWSEEDSRDQAGIINIIDLANKDSIAFIATDDLGRFTENGGFEVRGRIDNSDIRGCSLLSV